MMRFIISIILIGVSIAGFFVFTNPLLKEINTLKVQAGTYSDALDNAKALENKRDEHTQKYNSFHPDDVARLEKLLPDSVDNIRLVLEIEKMALPYGMVLRDVKYDSVKKEGENGDEAMVDPALAPPKDYGIWNLEFSTSATYNNYLNFLKDLESNLRIVDISSIQFSSTDGAGPNPNLNEVHKYNFKIKTYWLKD